MQNPSQGSIRPDFQSSRFCPAFAQAKFTGTQTKKGFGGISVAARGHSVQGEGMPKKSKTYLLLVTVSVSCKGIPLQERKRPHLVIDQVGLVGLGIVTKQQAGQAVGGDGCPQPDGDGRPRRILHRVRELDGPHCDRMGLAVSFLVWEPCSWRASLPLTSEQTMKRHLNCSELRQEVFHFMRSRPCSFAQLRKRTTC